MNKLMTMIGAFGFSLAVFAGAEDPLMMFSTPGPDAYADGTTVLDGECYALCYVTDAAAFTVKADGTATGGEVVLVAPVAKGGRCPEIMYQVPADVAAKLTGGSYAVYLLDTRVPAADGGYKVAQKDATGNWIVNGFTAVAEGGQAGGAGVASAGAFAGKTVTGGATIASYTEVDNPVISAVKVTDAKVTITVTGMSPLADYKVFTAPEPAGFSTKIDAKAEGDTFTFDKPADGKFFKVIGTRAGEAK